MSDAVKDRVKRWFNNEPEGFSLGMARDVLALEARVAALEANRPATPDSSPAGEDPMLAAVRRAVVECERLREENATLREERDEWELRCSVNKDTADKLAELRDRILFDNAAMRLQIAAPIDVEALRPVFERWRRSNAATRSSLGTLAADVTFAWLADRLNAAARKEVGE